MEHGSKQRRIDWASVCATALAALGLALVLCALPSLEKTPNWAEDFVAYRTAGLRLAEAGTLYSESSLTGAFEPLAQNLYLYPPPLGIAMGAFSEVPVDQGAVIWYLLHVACLALACALMPVQTRIRIVSFGLAAASYSVFRDLVMGNVSVMLLLPLVIGWRWLDRPAGSAALAVAASIRVTFGIFLLWFLVRRAWRALSWMAIAGAVLILLSLPFVGIDGYREYLVMMGNVRVPLDLLQNRQIQAVAITLGAPAPVAWAALPAVGLVAFGAIIASRRRDAEVGFMVTVAGSLLLAPTMWGHYLSLLVLPAAFLAQRGRPWALALPLLAWLPEDLMAFWAILALLLPFTARDAERGARQPIGPSRWAMAASRASGAFGRGSMI